MGYSSLAGTLFEKREKIVHYLVIKYCDICRILALS